MKTPLIGLIILAVMVLIAPFILQAREVSIEQVRQNVRNLQRLVAEGQQSITAKDFVKIIAGDSEFVLLDIRSEAEFNAAHLPGALNIERGRLEWIVPEIIKKTDRKIYVYGQNGRRSAFASERLMQMGYTNTYHIVDGFKGWVNAGNRVYNMHGEFVMTHDGYNKKEPVVGNIGR
jgi:phage shock protein E